MSNTIAAIDPVVAEGTPERGALKRRLERGLTTVEYAIGLLAAAAVALVLLRIFNDNAFFEVAFDWVVGVFNTISSSSASGLTGILGTIFGG
ncbi:MAG: DUF4244 domain-containing protein [Propionibacterium sp.]|nr:DUF4244 domain-containing protein [Propionibacterium sp.]